MSNSFAKQYQQALSIDINIELPAVAEILIAINDEVSSAEADIIKIAELITKDIFLSKSVLWMVNSPVYRLPRQITDIQLAVTLLGIDKIITAIYMPALNSALAIKPGISELLWKISILKGICASKFVEFVADVNADDAYIAGLFSVSGQLVLAQQKPDYLILLEEAYQSNISFFKLEMQRYEVNSSLVAFKLSELWKLPVPVMVAILLQDIEKYSELQDERVRGLIAILKVSEYCIMELLEHEPNSHLLFSTDFSQLDYALEELAISNDRFEGIKIDLRDELLECINEVLGY